mmetsp:Transcript_104164/g.299462  ORF Transcript_104164/g.299462 Transcript_104164/m.299462 type:complete len:271 (+) Transcript_104164:329-1141(+)
MRQDQPLRPTPEREVGRHGARRMPLRQRVLLHVRRESGLVHHDRSSSAGLNGCRRIRGVLQYGNSPPKDARPHDLVGRHHSAICQSDRLPTLQPAQLRPLGHTHAHRALHIEHARPIRLGEHVAPIRNGVHERDRLQPHPSDEAQVDWRSAPAFLHAEPSAIFAHQAVAPRSSASRDLQELKLETVRGKPATRASEDRLHHFPDSHRTHQKHRVLASLHGCGMQQAKDAKAMVAVQVCQQDGLEPGGPQHRAYPQVVLRALAAIHHDGCA